MIQARVVKMPGKIMRAIEIVKIICLKGASVRSTTQASKNATDHPKNADPVAIVRVLMREELKSGCEYPRTKFDKVNEKLQKPSAPGDTVLRLP